jgi:flagellar biosynthesis GTPase FlhF
MDQDKKNTSGAPSSDTTSALFVSARKKQLEQQEAEQRAKEKETQRLAAEAEVRRLEAEVEARRQKAAEDAKRADEEAQRIAEEARQKQAQAAENPDAILGAAAPQMPKSQKKEPGAASQSQSAGQGGGIADVLKNKKLLGIAGGGLALILIVVVLIVARGGGGDSAAPSGTATASGTVTSSGYDIGGIWYCDYQDGDFDTYHFLDDGIVEIQDYTGLDTTGAYEILDETIEVRVGEMEFAFVVDSDTLYDAGSDVTLTRELDGSGAAAQNGAPDGFSAYSDSATGLQLYYPDDLRAVLYLNSADEIVTVDSEDGMLSVMNITEMYDEFVATTNYDDMTILRGVSKAFLDLHSGTIFGTSNWTTSLGTQDIAAALEEGAARAGSPQTGRSFDTLAQYNIILNIDGSEANAYMALAQFSDSGLKVLYAIIWNPGTDAGDTLEDVMKSARIGS